MIKFIMITQNML